MAGRPSSRLTKPQVAKAIAHINSSKLLNRLMEHSLASEDIMTQSQIMAAKILLAKTLPDMRAMEHTGEVDVVVPNEIQFKVVK